MDDGRPFKTVELSGIDRAIEPYARLAVLRYLSKAPGCEGMPSDTLANTSTAQQKKAG